MKKLLLLFCFVLTVGMAGAQELIVKDSLALDVFTPYAQILAHQLETAGEGDKFKDLTGEYGAIVIVKIPSKEVSFSGSWIQRKMEIRYEGGKYYVPVCKKTTRFTVVVPNCQPFEVNFETAGLGSAESKSTYTITLQLPVIERTRAIIMPQYSIPTYSHGSLHGSYGLMVGFVKKHGAFLRAKSDFSFIKTSGECDAAGLVNGKLPWYTGESKRMRWAVTAGYVARVAKPFYLYGGVGYGQRVIAREQMDGTLIESSDVSYKGIEAEIGAIVRFGIFALSAGVQTNSFKYMEINAGVGVMF